MTAHWPKINEARRLPAQVGGFVSCMPKQEHAPTEAEIVDEIERIRFSVDPTEEPTHFKGLAVRYEKGGA